MKNLIGYILRTFFVLWLYTFSVYVFAEENTRFILMVIGFFAAGGLCLYYFVCYRRMLQINRTLYSIGKNSINESISNVVNNINTEQKKPMFECCNDTGVRFKDIAGCDEEKEEVKEIIDFLKNNQKYVKMGATIPRGILFVGPPGTGKTLLARAIAGEADVNFISVSGSEFIEKYVGTGAKRVRELFAAARMESPTLIFIDEIDTIGKQRGNGENGSEEREQTLNQLLIEMDGFDKTSNVVVIAATNRPELLDKALLRPGRFDRRITIGLPDTKARLEILKVHAKNKNFAKDVNLEEISKKTYGFSGAELYSLLNEAALLAIRSKKDEISNEDIYEAIDRVMMGPSKKSRRYTEKDKKTVAYHESGHALCGLLLKNGRKVERITIVPRGQAGGYTSYTPSDEKYFPTDTELSESIICLLGGRAAEDIVFNEVTTGASNDLKVATNLARSMVTEYGMSSLGLVQYENRNSIYTGYSSVDRNYSEEMAVKIDEEIGKIISDSYSKAKEILKENRDMLDEFVSMLLEKDTLNAEEINRIAEKYAVN